MVATSNSTSARTRLEYVHLTHETPLFSKSRLNQLTRLCFTRVEIPLVDRRPRKERDRPKFEMDQDRQ